MPKEDKNGENAQKRVLDFVHLCQLLFICKFDIIITQGSFPLNTGLWLNVP